MAKEQVYSLFDGSPESFGATVFDDFDGVITSAAYCAHRYSKDPNKKKHGLFVRMTIKPDDSEDEIELFQRAGFLNTHLPSKDGKVPAANTSDEYKALETGAVKIEEVTQEDYNNMMGPYVVCLGGTPKPLPPSDFHQFIYSLRELGFNKIDPRVDIIVGLHCHFNRLSVDESYIEVNGKKIQVNQKMPPIEGQEVREWKPLMPTQILEPLKGVKLSKSNGGSATTTSSSTSGSASDAEDELQTQIQLYLMENGETADKDLKNKIVMEGLKGQADKQKYALMQMSKVDWMRSDDRPWKFEGGKYSLTVE